jgi:hypothetical protein
MDAHHSTVTVLPAEKVGSGIAWGSVGGEASWVEVTRADALALPAASKEVTR